MASEEDSADLLMMNNTITEAMLVVFHVADGSLLGSGFSASYSGLDQGAPNVLSPSCRVIPGNLGWQGYFSIP